MTGVPDAHVLVTTEGRNIHTKQVVHATSQTITVDIPLRSNDQPNIFVAAAFLNDNKLYESTRNLKVPAIQTKLHIEIERTKDQFQPGQKAGYTIIARDANNKPVAGEFSLDIVDEAIYAIAPESSGDIHDFFYANVYDRVSTEASLSYYFNGEAGKKQMFLAYQSKNRTALAQLKPSQALVEPKVRKDFPDTALWLAEIRTDANGRAHADLNFPDSLTTWRATVRGVTADTKVGSAVDRVIVRKNLMVRLAVPRFFRQGDEVVVSTIIHNYLATSKTVHVSLALKGLDILDGQTREIEVPSRGEAKLDWRVRAQSVSEADLLAKALTNEESDALELTLPVIPFGVKLNDAKSGSILADRRYERRHHHSSRQSRSIRAVARRHAELVGGRQSLQCARLPHQLSLRLHRANHVQLSSRHRRRESDEGSPSAIHRGYAGTRKEDCRGHRAPQGLPARRRRLGLVER